MHGAELEMVVGVFGVEVDGLLVVGAGGTEVAAAGGGVAGEGFALGLGGVARLAIVWRRHCASPAKLMIYIGMISIPHAFIHIGISVYELLDC